MTRLVLIGGLMAQAVFLSACQKAAPRDAYAGLSEAIQSWRGDIVKTPACAVAVADGKACQSFEVGCKVEQPIGPHDKSVAAKVVAAMSWSEWSPGRGDYEPQSRGAVFSKVGGRWTRHELAGPINLSTCVAS